MEIDQSAFEAAYREERFLEPDESKELRMALSPSKFKAIVCAYLKAIPASTEQPDDCTEGVAIALFKHACETGPTPPAGTSWQSVPQDCRDNWRRIAEVAITAIPKRESGIEKAKKRLQTIVDMVQPFLDKDIDAGGTIAMMEQQAKFALDEIDEQGRQEAVTLPYDRNELFKRLCKLGTPINMLIGAARSASGMDKYHGVRKEWVDSLLDHAERAKEAWDGIVALFDDEQGRRG